MSQAGMTANGLREILAGLEPVELKGMALLRERRPQGHFFPPLTGDSKLSRETLVEAVKEIIIYTESSSKMAFRLTGLNPIPMTAFSVLEYGL